MAMYSAPSQGNSQPYATTMQAPNNQGYVGGSIATTSGPQQGAQPCPVIPYQSGYGGQGYGGPQQSYGGPPTNSPSYGGSVGGIANGNNVGSSIGVAPGYNPNGVGYGQRYAIPQGVQRVVGANTPSKNHSKGQASYAQFQANGLPRHHKNNGGTRHTQYGQHPNQHNQGNKLQNQNHGIGDLVDDLSNMNIGGSSNSKSNQGGSNQSNDSGSNQSDVDDSKPDDPSTGDLGYDSTTYDPNAQYYDENGGYYDEYGGYYDSVGGYYDVDGTYYDESGGCYDENGGYYDASGGYYDASGGYFDVNGDFYDTSGAYSVDDNQTGDAYGQGGGDDDANNGYIGDDGTGVVYDEYGGGQWGGYDDIGVTYDEVGGQYDGSDVVGDAYGIDGTDVGGAYDATSLDVGFAAMDAGNF